MASRSLALVCGRRQHALPTTNRPPLAPSGSCSLGNWAARRPVCTCLLSDVGEKPSGRSSPSSLWPVSRPPSSSLSVVAPFTWTCGAGGAARAAEQVMGAHAVCTTFSHAHALRRPANCCTQTRLQTLHLLPRWRRRPNLSEI